MTDTHCHIHDPEFKFNADQVLAAASQAGVNKLVCIGTSARDSESAVHFVGNKENCYAAIAQHPHEAKEFGDGEKILLQTLAETGEKVIAVGECGLDYYYSHSPKKDQEMALRWHFELANQHELPMIFHIRDAFEDFWKIYDAYPGTRGLVHSFTAGPTELSQALERGLYVAFNGIMTFTKDEAQLEALRLAPLDRLVMETDSPFLTPAPFRGQKNEPKYLVEVAKFISNFKEISYDELIAKTDENVYNILGI